MTRPPRKPNAAAGRSLRIGITLGLHRPDESLWNNGIKQNAIFLAKMFAASPRGHSVTLLNTTTVPVTQSLPWDLARFRTAAFADAWEGLDVLIELGGQINAEQTRALREQGTRIVSYCCGPEYVINIEAMIFRRRLWDSIFVNQDYDELWVIPQIAGTSLPFLQTLRRKPARIVPFVWDPIALETAVATREDDGLYRPADRPALLSVIEPNIDVLKFCLYPMLIAEQAYRLAPERIGYLHVANADTMAREDHEFAGIARQLDIVRDGKASFIGRVDTPHFLPDHTDVMISHQWGLPLNYIYLECCWQGFALVHNASLVSDLGYYYPENDVAEGAAQLLKAIDRHAANRDSYRTEQRQRIQRFLASDHKLIAAYDQLLDGLFAGSSA